MTAPEIPSLTGGDVTIGRRIQTFVNCPACGKSLDITDVRTGTTIACPNCENITWAPEYTPRWWHKTRNFIGAVIFSVLFGAAGSLLASYISHEIATRGENDLSEVERDVR